MAGPPQQDPCQGQLAIQNRRRPRQAEETVPSVRVTRATSFCCAAPHILIALADIERTARIVPLDANGFRRDKMMPILVGIRDGSDTIPPVPVEPIELGQRR